MNQLKILIYHFLNLESINWCFSSYSNKQCNKLCLLFLFSILEKKCVNSCLGFVTIPIITFQNNKHLQRVKEVKIIAVSIQKPFLWQCVFFFVFFTGIKGPILPNFIYFLFVLYIQVPCVREKFKEESKLSKESIIKISLFTMRIFAHTYHFFSLLCEEEWKRKTEFFFYFKLISGCCVWNH